MAHVRKKVKTVPRVNHVADLATSALSALPMTPIQTKKVVKELLVDGDNWPARRRVLFFALLFCFGNVQYLILWGDDTSLHKETVSTLLWVLAAIIGTYVFGAVWDDRNRRDTMMDYGALNNGYDPNHPLDQGNE